jgi:hypothetical protein
MTDVTPKQFSEILRFMVPRKRVVMITGAPGTGKTSLVHVYGLNDVGRIVFRHPGTEDPTYPSGFPWCYQVKGMPVAKLVMYEFNEFLLNATEPTLVFLDDFGQATNAVQCGYMPLLLDRTVGGKPISEHISFVLATNRREDRANVSGVLMPVRSRCSGGIYNLITSTRDWKLWALKEGMPRDLIQYISFMESKRENRLLDPNPPKEISGYYCPRTVAEVGYALNDDLPAELEQTVFSGICGESWAAEYVAFRKIAGRIPSNEEIIARPDTAKVPDYTDRDGAAMLFAVCGRLSMAATEDNFSSIIKYANRMPEEYRAMLLDDCVNPDTEGNPALTQNIDYIRYSSTQSRSNVGLN